MNQKKTAKVKNKKKKSFQTLFPSGKRIEQGNRSDISKKSIHTKAIMKH